MEIQLRLYGALRRYRPPGTAVADPFLLKVADGATLSDVIEQLGIPRSWVRTSFVHGEGSQKDRVLNPGDEVALFPPAGGG